MDLPGADRELQVYEVALEHGGGDSLFVVLCKGLARTELVCPKHVWAWRWTHKERR